MKKLSLFLSTLCMFFTLTSATTQKQPAAVKSPWNGLYAKMYFDNEYYDMSGNIYEDVNVEFSSTYSTYTAAVFTGSVNYWVYEYDELDDYEVGYTYYDTSVSGSDVCIVPGALVDDTVNSYTYNLTDGNGYYASAGF